LVLFFISTLLTALGDSFGKYTEHVRGEEPVRDLMFMLAPVALVLYFVVFPDQFSAFLGWAGQYLH
jgi:hypothetical protein